MSKNIITSKITPEEHFFNSLRRFPNIRLSILKSSYILQDEDAIAMIKTNNTRSSTITKPTSPPPSSSLIENKNKISTSKMNKTSLYNYYSNSKKMNLLKSIELSKKLNDLKGSCLEDVEQHLLPIRSRIRKKHIQVKQNNLDIYNNNNINNIIIKNRDNNDKDSVIIYDDSMNVLNNNNISSSTSTKKHIVKSKVTFIDPTRTAATTIKIHDDIYKNINNDDHDDMNMINIAPYTPVPIKKAIKSYTLSSTDGGDGGGGANPATTTTSTPTIQVRTATHKRSSRSNRSSKGKHKNSKLITNSTIIINNDNNLNNNKHIAKNNTSPINENDYNNDHKNHLNHTLSKKSWDDLCKKLTKCGIKFKTIDDLIDCGLIEILDIMKYTKPTINDLDLQFELNLGLKLTDEQLLLLYKLLFPTTISVIHKHSDFLISSLT